MHVCWMMGIATLNPSYEVYKIAEEPRMDTLETRLAARPRHISPEEWQVRVDLAACYRLIAHFGWDDLVLTHNSARVPGPTGQILINPRWLLFDEAPAFQLHKGLLAGEFI